MSKCHIHKENKRKSMRLFIASPVILDDYISVQKDFEGIIEGKWVEEENLHLTWVFLGEVDDPRPMMESLKALSMLKEAVDVSELGYFGRPPRIFFTKAESKLLYQKAREFRKAGFDIYRFKPHITLCRIKKIHDYKAYKEKLKYYREQHLGTILPQIHLYKSELTPHGAIHTRLA
jgi:2'-5' RNA ligase